MPHDVRMGVLITPTQAGDNPKEWLVQQSGGAAFRESESPEGLNESLENLPYTHWVFLGGERKGLIKAKVFRHGLVAIVYLSGEGRGRIHPHTVFLALLGRPECRYNPARPS